MRTINLADGLRLRFPGRGEDFDEGVEVGMIAALMSLGLHEFTRSLTPLALDQAREVAPKLGYHIAEECHEDGSVSVRFRFGVARPRLQLVHSRQTA